jgi:HAD superfamily hydrolase (TIGR01509 family)
MMLSYRNAWIFDMDGTLTVAMHDFDAIRAELDLPPGEPILESLARLSPAKAAPLHQRLDALELELAAQARPQPGAQQLLQALSERGVYLGILTRNTQPNAIATLQACGLLSFFEPACILGRKMAAPKPSPNGINQLLKYWQVQPAQAVMVGVYLFVLQAGRAAATATVYVDICRQKLWADQADIMVHHLAELLEMITD